MAKCRVYFEEKRSPRQYESVTVAYSREFDDTEEQPQIAFNIVKAQVLTWMDQALKSRPVSGQR